MRRLISGMLALVVSSLVILGCTQPAAAPAQPAAPTKAPAAAPAAAPTKAPAAPAQAAAPTKAPVAQPTTAPAKKVDFPTAGKPVTVIVPWPAGGVLDVCARILAPVMEKDLGVPVVIVNKAGASGQMGATELIKSRPDGYTVGYITLPATITPYLDPQRKASATYARKDFKMVSLHVVDPEAIVVTPDSPFKSLKDLVDAAKAKPEQIKFGTSGLLTNNHLALLLFQKAADARISLVHFEGAPPAITAMLGGHIDAGELTVGATAAQVKSGKLRYLGVYDTQRSQFFPSVPTLEEQGYKVSYQVSRGFAVPADTPNEIVEILAASFKKAMDDKDVKAKMDEVALEQRFMGPAQFSSFWDELEKQTEPLLVELAKQSK